MLYTHHHYLYPKPFHHPQHKLCTNWTITSPLPLPQPLVTSILLSVSMNLLILGTSYKWNHTLFVLLFLAYFIKQNVFKIHPCCSIYQNFIPFYGWIMFSDPFFIIKYVYHSFTWWIVVLVSLQSLPELFSCSRMPSNIVDSQ